MTKKDAILCLKGMKNYARDTFTEQTDWQESLDMAIEALEEDTVSRQATLDMIDNSLKIIDEYKAESWMFAKTIFDKHGYTAECSCCHKKWKAYDEIRFKKEHNFCPNCGAKMEE